MGRLDRLKEEIKREKKPVKELVPVKRNPERKAVANKPVFSEKGIDAIAAALRTLMKE